MLCTKSCHNAQTCISGDSIISLSPAYMPKSTSHDWCIFIREKHSRKCRVEMAVIVSWHQCVIYINCEMFIQLDFIIYIKNHWHQMFTITTSDWQTQNAWAGSACICKMFSCISWCKDVNTKEDSNLSTDDLSINAWIVLKSTQPGYFSIRTSSYKHSNSYPISVAFFRP